MAGWAREWILSPALLYKKHVGQKLKLVPFVPPPLVGAPLGSEATVLNIYSVPRPPAGLN